MTTLPVNVDLTYPDDALDASVKAHQQHHDTLHGVHNDPATNWTQGNATYLALANVPINVLDAPYNCDPTGALDAGPGIKQAITDSWAPYPRVRSVYVPPGNYKIATAIDLAALAIPGDLNGWQFVCDAGAVFIQDAALTTQVVNLTPPGAVNFHACKIRLGVILGTGAGSCVGVRIRGFDTSHIRIGDVRSMGSNGVAFPAEAARGVFNNRIDIDRIILCGGNGLSTSGNATVFGVQGNRISIGQVAECLANGINIDGAINLNTIFNIFDIQVAEHNAAAGITDNAGLNSWRIGNTNANSVGYLLPAGVTNVPRIQGTFTDGVNLNSQPADLIDYSIATGHIASPAVPATTVALANSNRRPAMVYITGGTVTVIAINGTATGLTSGAIRLLPGETITLTYTAAPTWTWFLTN